eukprot:TRINITY_DN217_c0_g1_i13.p2 TRINITY_DN217_c0_g1~~TRINITY_DN217_c0_g1_i13.p2  ORF type:complete len:568 (+),score=268.54 TRINITY_DN217_c0_g1_i13:56-1759(+)
MADYKMLINGELVDAKETFDVINPATGKAFAKAPHCDAADVDAAVAAAVAAYPSWRDTPIEERRACLQNAIGIIAQHKEALGELLCKEQGKPKGGETPERTFVGASLEMMMTLNVMGKALAISPEPLVHMETEGAKVEVCRRPLGAVAGIGPWNFPVLCMFQKVAPAVVLGNTFVGKPSPFTPLSTLAVVALIKDCFPKGVLNMITADDSKFRAGAHLTAHPDIRKVSFTGSVPTGKAIMKACSDDVKRMTLEMGGNDAAIVRGDVDVKKAAAGVFGGAFANTGQVCVAVKRAYVHSSIYDEFVKELVKNAEEAKFGDGMEATTMYGPLNNKMQFDKVCEFVEDAKKNGAKIETGGKPMDRDGYFYEPTIVSGVKEGFRIVDEEQFGPVLPVIPYDDDEDALARANGTKYGLGGSVWSSDIEVANKMAARMESGTVWVNEHLGDTDGAPFGGMKHSGLGRENGCADLAAWTEMQSLKTVKGGAPVPPSLPPLPEQLPLPSADYKMLINGELVDAKETFDVINPATGKAFAKAPHCDAADVDAAVAAAVAAYPSWRDTPIEERRACQP